MIAGISISGLIRETRFYNSISEFELIKNELIYKIVGLDIIKWLVTKTFWRNANPKLIIRKRPGITELETLRKEMILAELSHFIGFVILIIVFVTLVLRNKEVLGTILMVTNIFFNLYPALLQQRNKSRIKRLILHATGPF